MHPAPSVIVFTTASGLGFGFLVFLGAGWPAPTGWAAFWQFALGFALAVGGLMASALHLGHPERALLAFTQWRSSWLSREAVLSVGALLALGVHAAASVFFGRPLAVAGWIGAALSLATVLATAMIYTQMRTVPRWRQWATPALFLALALAGGAILAGHRWLAAALLVGVGPLAWRHWHKGDRRLAESGTNMATATGLKGESIRHFEPPHTGRNYLLDEMVFRIGRKHAMRLRALSMMLMVVVPALMLALFGAGWPVRIAAALVHLAGVLAQRWLFFAEAEHVLGLYYGQGSAARPA